MDPGNEQQQILFRSRRSAMETLAMIKQARQVKRKFKSMLIIFFDIKEIVHKNFVRAGQRVNSTYNCDVLRRLRENLRRLRPEFWRQKSWLLHNDNAPSQTSFSTMKFLTRNNLTVVPHPPYLSLFPRLKAKLKGRHFYTIVAMEVES
jgi:hypothetical protein